MLEEPAFEVHQQPWISPCRTEHWVEVHNPELRIEPVRRGKVCMEKTHLRRLILRLGWEYSLPEGRKWRFVWPYCWISSSAHLLGLAVVWALISRICCLVGQLDGHCFLWWCFLGVDLRAWAVWSNAFRIRGSIPIRIPYRYCGWKSWGSGRHFLLLAVKSGILSLPASWYVA